jgi:RimJ/RimL family protein N-acetyltransferase
MHSPIAVELRPLRAADSSLLHGWINDRSLVELSAPFRPVARSEHERWFDQVRRRSDVRIYAIVESAALSTIGYCQLKGIDRAAGTAELQIRIGIASHHGRGAGRQAVRALLDVAFGELGLREVRLHVFESNLRAIRCYLACGFARQPTAASEAVTVGGRQEKIMWMSIAAGTFRQAISRRAAS